MEKMTYEQTVELERNIKIKNKAKEIVAGFLENVKLNLQTKKGLRFRTWSDSNNAEYVDISEDGIYWCADYLHQKYYLMIDESSIFDAILREYRGIEYLASKAKVSYNPNDYKA